MPHAQPLGRICVVGTDNRILADADALQGLWTQDQYLAITNACNHLLEFTDGAIEVLPMPTRHHQAIARLLFLALFDFVSKRGGEVFYAPLRLRIRDGKFREPDLLLVRDAGDPRNQNAYWLGADLVVEVVGPDNPMRDLRVKRDDYAEASIPEYWIANPLDETITVLVLAGDEYVEHGVFVRGDDARGVLFPGFAVEVGEVFDAR